MKFKCLFLSLAVLLPCLFSGCQGDSTPHKVTGIYFDTVVELTVYGESVPDEALKLCEKYDKLFSATNEESEIYRLNKEGSLEVSPETLNVIKTALEFSEESKDLFCIAILPIARLWDFTAENPKLPNQKELNSAIESVSSANLQIEGNRVTLKNGAAIDLGAIAKGYIADKIAELYRKSHLAGIINLGGNVLTVGEKPDGTTYKVGVKKPFTQEENLCTLEISQAAVSTCGVYERYFELEGELYHHILNPRTGYPQKSELLSVTVIHENSTAADALSTMFFMLGEDGANEYMKSHKGTYAVFTKDDGSVSFSEGFENATIVKATVA